MTMEAEAVRRGLRGWKKMMTMFAISKDQADGITAAVHKRKMRTWAMRNGAAIDQALAQDQNQIQDQSQAPAAAEKRRPQTGLRAAVARTAVHEPGIEL